VQLELIDPRQLHDNKFLSHPVAVEQYLMEGGYNRVFKTRADIPADSYAYFHDIMADTVRCASESMLESIPNAKTGIVVLFIAVLGVSRGGHCLPQGSLIHFPFVYSSAASLLWQGGDCGEL
jgi:26S proteasome regulatory subunit N12